MKLTNNWFTSVTEGEGGTMVIVCGRDEIDAFMASGKFGERVYTGDGARTWIFYTRNIPAFGERLNQALAPFEQLPITIYTEKDPDWNEYREMCSLCEDACRDVQSDDEG